MGFGWEIQKWLGPQDYWSITTGKEGTPGINGGLMKRMIPSPTTVNSIAGPSVDDFVAKITENGGRVVAPKIAVPGVGDLAYCQDPEGNTFGIIQWRQIGSMKVRKARVRRAADLSPHAAGYLCEPN